MFWHIQYSNNFYFFWKWAQKQSPTVLGFGRKPWFSYLKRTAFQKDQVKLSLNGALQVNVSWQTITNKINCNQQRLHLHLWITQIPLPCVTQGKDSAGKPLILLSGSEHCNFWHSKEDLLQCKPSSQGPAWLSSGLRHQSFLSPLHLYSISILIFTGAQKPQQLSKGNCPL